MAIRVQDALVQAERAPGRPIAGLASLDRVVLSAIAAGIQRIAIVSREPERDRARLREGSGERATLVFLVPGSLEERAYLAALARDARPFLYLHTEAAFDPHLLPRLVAEPERGELIDLPAAGIARLPGAAAAALLGGVEGAERGLAGLRSQADAGGSHRLFDAAPGHASRVVDETSRKSAEQAIVRTAGKATDGLVSRHLNRRISITLTGRLLPTGVTPNMLTLGTLGLGLLTGLTLIHGSHAGLATGALLYHVNSTLDGCDGEVARLKFLSSRFGEWFDTTADTIGNLVFFAGFPFGLARLRGGDPLYYGLSAFLGVGGLLMLALVSWRTRRVSQANNFNDYGSSLARSFPPGSMRAQVVALLSSLFRRDTYALLFFLLAALGLHRTVAWLLGAGLLAHFPSVLLSQTPLAAGTGEANRARSHTA